MLADELSELARGIGQGTDDNDVVRMLASLVAASHEFIGIADLEGNALFVNEAGRRLVGLRDLEAVHSTRLIDYFAPDDQPKVLQEVLPAVRATGFWQGELRFRNFATGELVPVLYNIFPVRDSSGATNAYGTVTRNLTEAKRTELQLRSIASIVESSDDAIVSKNLNGVIASWNSGAERIFGYSAKEAIGQPITILIPEDRQDEEREILARIRRGERIDHFETIRQRKDGRSNRHLAHGFSRQRRRRQDRWRIENRERHYRAEAGAGANHCFGPGDRTPKQECPCERTGHRHRFSG
jgi:PAS domain S-box-containing protein